MTGALRRLDTAELEALLLQRADPLPGTKLVFRGLIAIGRSAFARAYARAYRQGSREPLRQLDSWLIVHAAARLSEGITVEEPKLIALLERAHRKPPA